MEAAPAPIVKAVPLGKDAALVTMSVPDDTVVPPAYVLTPESVTVPAPLLVRLPAPPRLAVTTPLLI